MTERTAQTMRNSDVTLIGKVQFSRDKEGKVKTWEYDTGEKVPFGDLGAFRGIKASAKSSYMGTRIPFEIDLGNDLKIRCSMSQWLNPEGREGEPLSFTIYKNGTRKDIPFKKRKKDLSGTNAGFTIGLNPEKKNEAGQVETTQLLCLFDAYTEIRNRLVEDMWVEVRGKWNLSLYEADGNWRQNESLDVTSIRIVDEPKSGVGKGAFSQELIMAHNSWEWNESSAANGIQHVNARVIYKAKGEKEGPHAFDFKFELRNDRNLELPLWKASLENFFDIDEEKTKAVNWLFRIAGGSSSSIGKVSSDDPFAGAVDEEEDDFNLVAAFTQKKNVFWKPSGRIPSKVWTIEDYGVSVFEVGEQGGEVNLDDDSFDKGDDPFGIIPSAKPMNASEIVNQSTPTENEEDDLSDFEF